MAEGIILIGMAIDPSPDLMWISDTEDGKSFENRVFIGDPRPACDLCQACRIIDVGGGRFACTRQTPGMSGGERLRLVSA